VTEQADIGLQRIECPNCAAGIDVTQAMATGAVACHSCGSVLNRRTLGIVGELVAGNYDADSNLQLGWVCTYHSRRYRISGRVRYTYAQGHWDEWVMIGDDGSVAYLEECEGEFRWFTPWTPRAAPTRAELEDPGRSLHIDGLVYRVKENLHAQLAWFQGQLPWRASVGMAVRSLDLQGPAGPAAVEWSRRELEFYKAKPLGRPAIVWMFSGYNVDLGAYDDDDDDDDEVSLGSRIISGMFTIMLVIFVLLMIFGSATGVIGGGGGGYGGGHSSSGGFGGGK
jgi:hypothetical protein